MRDAGRSRDHLGASKQALPSEIETYDAVHAFDADIEPPIAFGERLGVAPSTRGERAAVGSEHRRHRSLGNADRATACIGGNDRGANARLVVRWVLANRKTEISVLDVRMKVGLGGRTKAKEAEEILDDLVVCGFLQEGYGRAREERWTPFRSLAGQSQGYSPVRNHRNLRNLPTY
jgi:hypothetical protein